MRQKKDFTGQKFCKLTAIKRQVSDDKYRRVSYLCKCDCGNFKVVRHESLRSGDTRSCGCLYFDDLRGRKFGRLTVQNEYKRIFATEKSKHKTVKWFCKCDCGKEKWVGAPELKNGHTQSCGCYGKERRRLEFAQASKNKCYDSYRRQAKNNNRDFSITFDEFIEITSKKCCYCGSDPSNKFNNGLYNGTYIYNGIDRVDNNKGYVKSNCVPCCKKCNISKRDMSRKDFLDWIMKVYEYTITGETRFDINFRKSE